MSKPARFIATSIERYRADARRCRSLGIKVGSTATRWLVWDRESNTEGYVTTYGGTPATRRAEAISMFACGVCDNGAKPTVRRSTAEINASIDAKMKKLDAFIASFEG